MKKLTANLSGFGGEYEVLCQTMLWRGVAYLAELKPPVEMWSSATEYKNVHGIFEVNGEPLKTSCLLCNQMGGLEVEIMRPPTDGCTGAMHQVVMQNLRMIHKFGVDGWLAMYREKSPDLLYEAEVTL